MASIIEMSDNNRRIKGFSGNKKEYEKYLAFVATFKRAVTVLSSAQYLFQTLNVSDISPDGKLGGSPYAKTVREIAEHISLSLRNLADILATLQDELKNPIWKELMEISEEAVEELQNAAELIGELEVDGSSVINRLVEDEMSGVI